MTVIGGGWLLVDGSIRLERVNVSGGDCFINGTVSLGGGASFVCDRTIILRGSVAMSTDAGGFRSNQVVLDPRFATQLLRGSQVRALNSFNCAMFENVLFSFVSSEWPMQLTMFLSLRRSSTPQL
jgi:hypothetical protein